LEGFVPRWRWPGAAAPQLQRSVPQVSLVSVLTPDSDVELLTVSSMLEARGVPFFVRGAGLGSLFPGPMQVGSLSARTIMVPEERAEEAAALIADYLGTPESKPSR
jgi:hypothetical protein